VDHHGQRVHGLVVHEDLHLDEPVLAVAGHLVVEARVALGHRLEPVVEVEDDLVQRQVVDDHRAAAGIGEVELEAAAVLAELQHVAQVVVGDEDGGLDPRLLDMLDIGEVGHVGGVVQLHHRAVLHVDVVDHGRRGGDEVDVVFALEPVADHLEVEEPEEAAAEAEAEGGRGLHLEVKEASLRASFSMASRRSSNSLASTGKRPQKTTGIEGLKPGSAVAQGGVRG
jgi:hypothetical protein